ncbi:Squalene synthase [hydrothermal vent metagenome]|uniref:Squalene synthase n=1 Tax=hydrothermal vent metagenome TaxID=652676 RepID=A0A3B1A6Z4_9ZZZZ
MTTLTLQQAYQHCQQIVRNHYENFPVASWFLPKKLRLPISVIYAFARHADDLADEGELNDSERYKALEHYQADFEKALKDSYSDNPLFFALTDVIKNHQLPTNLFFDLLTAFKMDTKTKRYANFDDVLNYCHYSANPVGRLLLHLHKQNTAENLQNSDAICTALQLINFYQDIHQDIQENNRIYIPTNELAQFNITEQHFSEQINDVNMQRLMQFQTERAEKLMLSGTILGQQLAGLFGLEIRMIIQGGLAITYKLQKISNVFDRPRLTSRDKFVMLWHALRKTT